MIHREAAVPPFPTLPGKGYDATVRCYAELFDAYLKGVPNVPPLSQEALHACGTDVWALGPVVEVRHVPDEIGA